MAEKELTKPTEQELELSWGSIQCNRTALGYWVTRTVIPPEGELVEESDLKGLTMEEMLRSINFAIEDARLTGRQEGIRYAQGQEQLTPTPLIVQISSEPNIQGVYQLMKETQIMRQRGEQREDFNA